MLFPMSDLKVLFLKLAWTFQSIVFPWFSLNMCVVLLHYTVVVVVFVCFIFTILQCTSHTVEKYLHVTLMGHFLVYIFCGKICAKI